MKERPILFSAPMVRALLYGTKTQTRRVVKGFPLELLEPDNFTPEYVADPENSFCPYGRAGDRLWVREAFCEYGGRTIYRADYGAFTPISDGIGGPWKPSIHMPRAASRILLEITEVRVQRLCDISESDASAEGVDFGNVTDEATGEIDRDAAEAFAALWESINSAGSWDANPWVWAITFKRLT